MGGNSNTKVFDNEDEAVKYLEEQHKAAAAAWMSLMAVEIIYNHNTNKYEYKSYYEA